MLTGQDGNIRRDTAARASLESEVEIVENIRLIAKDASKLKSKRLGNFLSGAGVLRGIT